MTVACIDAGGTHTRVVALDADQIVFRGRGGPANPTAVDEATLRASLAAASSGCPPVDSVLAFVAGAGSPATQDRIGGIISDLLAGARVRVLPDYVGAFWSCPPGTDVCVIAGTGSAVVSPDGARDGWLLSGGRGWILGDPGSAADLGLATLRIFANEPERFPLSTQDALLRAYEADRWQQIARRLQLSATQAHDLALAAPILTALADAGSPVAQAVIEQSMASLAELAARHIDERLGRPTVTVGLRGGVFSSASVRAVFLTCLRKRARSTIVAPDDGHDSMAGLDQMLRLARVPGR